jgi:hypothetical protein
MKEVVRDIEKLITGVTSLKYQPLELIFIT